MYRPDFKLIARHRIVTPDNVVMRLNRGERPEPLPLAVQVAISNALSAQLGKVQQYPSYSEFYKQLSVYYGVSLSQLVVGAGIEEFIRTLMFMCCAPRQKAAVLWPTCAMYDIYAAAFNIDLIRIKPQPGVKLSVDSLIQALPKDLRVLFIPNPGQPVETYFDNRELAMLAIACAKTDTLLAIDEAHYGFGASTALPLINWYDNVVVLRTFSKFFGAASIRVGAALGAPKLIAPLDSVRPSGEISGPSLVIASELLRHADVMKAEAAKIAASRDWLVKELPKLGVRAWGRFGFSVLIELDTAGEADWVGRWLAATGIYVKSNFPSPVEKCIMVSCPINAKTFLEAFENVLCESRAGGSASMTKVFKSLDTDNGARYDSKR